MRVVLHAPANRVRVFQHARTLLGDGSLDLQALSVVAHGGAVDLLVADGRHAGRVERLLDHGVDVVACRRSMDRQDVVPDALVDGVRTAPSGLGELARLQEEDGYVYVRA